MSLVTMAVAALQIVAGIKTLSFRGYKLSITSWIVGLAACMTCYCGPTSIGLLVYGLIVFLNPATKRAFDLRSQGLSAAEIEKRFY